MACPILYAVITPSSRTYQSFARRGKGEVNRKTRVIIIVLNIIGFLLSVG